MPFRVALQAQQSARSGGVTAASASRRAGQAGSTSRPPDAGPALGGGIQRTQPRLPAGAQCARRPPRSARICPRRKDAGDAPSPLEQDAETLRVHHSVGATRGAIPVSPPDSALRKPMTRTALCTGRGIAFERRPAAAFMLEKRRHAEYRLPPRSKFFVWLRTLDVERYSPPN